MDPYLLSCDWGTSSFRLRLVDRQTTNVAAELTSANGVSETFRVWKEKGIHLMLRQEFFYQQLGEQVQALARRTGQNLDGIPLVLSGMPSSSIGMIELPYADIPFPLDGRGLVTTLIEQQAGFRNDVILLSGVRSERDVMRGEETQLIGLNALMQIPVGRDMIFIFPGTHSKHMYVRDEMLLDFRTFMTGEIYNVIASHSILKDSVELQGTLQDQSGNREAFARGVAESGSGFILNALFTVRTNQLFDLFDKKQNAMYLSGLLIGSELRYLLKEKNRQLVLCSGNNLFDLYKTAVEELGLAGQTEYVAADEVDRAATAAHLRVLEHYRQSTLNKSYE